MIVNMTGEELANHKALSKSMFEDRAWQFKKRLKWNVQVNEFGQEKDAYDLSDTLYVIYFSESGLHLGSMRFRPTMEPNLIKDHFSYVLKDNSVFDHNIWECTRFCIAPSAPKVVAKSLFAAGANLMKEFELRALIAVFDRRMKRVYRRHGVIPEVIASSIDGQGMPIEVGLWHYNETTIGQIQHQFKRYSTVSERHGVASLRMRNKWPANKELRRRVDIRTIAPVHHSGKLEH